ncbi:MAG: hypothetical protein ACRDHF_09295 [Tepidiformaceae bacterium]
MLAFEVMRLLQQKAEAGDPLPAFFSDIALCWDPRRGGSNDGIIVDVNAAGTVIAGFTVPRDGLYQIEASVFARLGSVRNVLIRIVDQVAGQSLMQHLAVATSQGWRWGPYLMLLRAADTVNIQLNEAMILGDSIEGTVWNTEVAMG